jgi:hypothetical protein
VQAAHTYSWSHTFVLEATELAETPRTTVSTQLLGPHSVRHTTDAMLPCLLRGCRSMHSAMAAYLHWCELSSACWRRVGEQAMFCWRLKLMGAADMGLVVAYDAFADAEAWAPSGIRSSYVSLPGGPGRLSRGEPYILPALAPDH